MRRRQIGTTEIQVTELGFGAAPIGNLYREVTDQRAAEAVDAAWDAGIRYFDTAPHYGLGLSERRLGVALAGRPRHEYVISTKVGRILAPNPAPTGSDLNDGMFAVPDDLTRRLDYSGDGVRRSLESSLLRLGLDRIDIALVHDPDEHVEQTVTEAIPALIALRDEGVIGAVGVGMNQWQAPLHILGRTDIDVVMLAGRWTLLDRSGAPLLEACAARGVSVLAAAPFNSGLLAQTGPIQAGTYDYGSAPAEILDQARYLAKLAGEHDALLPQAALQFPLRHPATACVVTGMGRPDHVRSSARWLGEPISEAFWTELGPRPNER
jgi:D-threo-aldose 1-dehydrogenase